GTQGHESITAFIVPTHQPGVSVQHMSRMVGHHSTGTALITLTDAVGERLGGEKEGFALAMKTLEDGRGVAINAIIQASLETTVEEMAKAYRKKLTETGETENPAWQDALTGFMADAFAARL